MPFKNQSMTLGAGYLLDQDGKAWIQISEIKEFTEESYDTDLGESFNLFTPIEFTGTVEIPRSAKRYFSRLTYGWKNRGPIRKRLLNRLRIRYGNWEVNVE